MAYDLFLWPLDGPVSYDEAKGMLEAMLDDDKAEWPTDRRLRSFMRDLEARFPEAFPDDAAIDAGWQPAEGAVFFEMNEEPGCVLLGIPDSCVATVAAAAQAIGGVYDLVVFDPQAESVTLPPRFGDTEVDRRVDPTTEEG
jgi:hypothetical protein